MRVLHRIYAKHRGYFWRRCECGRWFGGHENYGLLYRGAGDYKFTCPRCRAHTGAVRKGARR
jgi:hypothetical protein